MSDEIWPRTTIAPDRTHHLVNGEPLYTARFRDVLEFHSPGLAAVLGDSGAYHIKVTAIPAYPQRYVRTFGFYEERAAVQAGEGWFHIRPDGTRLYAERYAWCGNYQDGRCTVRDDDGAYFHIDPEGRHAYRGRYRYAGDFRKGAAVVQRHAGMLVHIRQDGNLLNGTAWLDLDVFHKGFARARDRGGWTHIDESGRPLYPERYAMVEPFYNGQARVETHDGALLIINEVGPRVSELRPARRPVDTVSADLVGYWRTLSIATAVELGLFQALPATTRELDERLGLAPGMAARLVRGLHELGLVSPGAEGRWETTDRGNLLHASHPHSMAPAARVWAGVHLDAWRQLGTSLRSGQSAFEALFGCPFFAWLAEKPDERSAYHRALRAYAQEDYAAIPSLVHMEQHRRVIDAGGGSGDLLSILLRAQANLIGALLERPEVACDYTPPPDLVDRIEVLAADIFDQWPTGGDAIFLARVLHDWPDEAAVRILRRAANALDPGGHLYVVEGLLGEKSPTNGLLDLNMLVMTGGRERDLRDFKELLQAAGLRLADARRLDEFHFVIESVLT
ncbi:MAG: methyltransferase [Chloroflexi bacterium]|nr:methyltransferase [Chloroflexota bacterium]